MISIDTKKKEVLGQLTRNQPVLSNGNKAPDVYDHDFSFLATGKAIPHGIFDTKLNRGYISIGNSHETAHFVIDNLDWWWRPSHGKIMENIFIQKQLPYSFYVIVAEQMDIDIIYSKNVFKIGLKR